MILHYHQFHRFFETTQGIKLNVNSENTVLSVIRAITQFLHVSVDSIYKKNALNNLNLPLHHFINNLLILDLIQSTAKNVYDTVGAILSIIEAPLEYLHSEVTHVLDLDQDIGMNISREIIKFQTLTKFILVGDFITIINIKIHIKKPI